MKILLHNYLDAGYYKLDIKRANGSEALEYRPFIVEAVRRAQELRNNGSTVQIYSPDGRTIAQSQEQAHVEAMQANQRR